LLVDIATFANRISAAGAVNSLAQALLKLTIPGVPDFYQGTEFWDYSLVDPDNRSPVDFASRSASLDEFPLSSLVRSWRDGRIKQAIIARTLALRRACPALFADGSYEPLYVRGAFADRVIAFARRLGDDMIVVIVPRTASQMLRTEQGILFEEAAWRDTCVATNCLVLTDFFRTSEPVGPSISLGASLSEFPVALLISPRLRRAL